MPQQDREYTNSARIKVGNSLELTLSYNGVTSEILSDAIFSKLSKVCRELDSLLSDASSTPEHMQKDVDA